jgi:hypothetical protein
MRLLTVPVILLAWLSCRSAERAERDLWQGWVDTLTDGIVRVHNPAMGIWDSTTAWSVTINVRIGQADGSGPDVFGYVGGLALDPAGRIYILDSQAQQIRVFARQGTYVRTIGRKGAGPGEFTNVWAITFSPAGELWVLDPQNARYSVFDTSGVYVRSHRSLAHANNMTPWPGGFDQEGRLYDRVPRPGGRGDPVFAVHDTNLQYLDSVPLPAPSDEGFFQDTRFPGLRLGIPYTGHGIWTFDPRGYVWLAYTSEYRIWQTLPTGDTVRVIEREFEALPVTPDDVEAALGEGWITRWQKRGFRFDASKIPAVKPAIATFRVDATGALWVSPITTSEVQARLLDVFDPDGRYLGEVLLPFTLDGRARPIITDDAFIAVTRDELDVQYVVVGRIHKPRVARHGGS